MKAILQPDGFIVIQPENLAELFALKHLVPADDMESCGQCGRIDLPVIFEYSLPEAKLAT